MEKYEYKVTAAGRVNIIGEHIDYCGGKVFPAALSLKNTVYVRENGGKNINLRWTTLTDSVSLDTESLTEYKNLRYGNYQAGSALMWKNAGHKVIGCDMLQDCSVPFGSGLSSSAAIEVSTIAALAVIAGETPDPVETALLAQKAEREYAGVNCGIMDQYASACGKKGQAMLLDCKTLQCKYVPVRMGDCELVIINTKKPHNLVVSKYNERRAETELAFSLLKEKTGIECLAELTGEQFEKYKHLLPDKVRDRTEHVVKETARVRLAEQAMEKGDMVALGRLLNESHASLKNLYEVTGIELDTLAAAAEAHPACLGSRMTGAGFGGCTLSIVRKDGAEDFKKHVMKVYERTIGYAAECYDAFVADGITVEKI